MKEFQFDETSIQAEFTFNLMENYDLVWMTDRTPGLYRTIFFTMADILKHYKSKTTPRIGFILKDTNGAFKFGAILNYHTPDEDDDGDDKGNYTLEFTLDEADMKDLDVTVDNHSDVFVISSTKMANDIMGGRFKTNEFCNNLFIEAIDTLVKFMDANADAGEEVSVVYKGVFTADVVLENGKKVISITPGEMIKQFIKSDSAL